MERHLYACNASPLEFCQYPYSPKRGLPFGTEPPAVAVFESGRLRLYTFCQKVESIAVSLDTGNAARQRFFLESDGSGNWGIDLFDLPPGRYLMQWYYDGIPKLNRHAPVCYERGEIRNFVEIPQRVQGDFELWEVPHGTIRQEYLKSKTYQGFANCWIYTPPFYRAQNAGKYPVLYLVSGMSGNETTWFGNVKFDMLLDNLLSEQRCREMLAVSVCTQEPATQKGLEKADAFLRQDVIPFVEAHFPVRTDQYAVAGLLDGAVQAEYIASRNPKMFAYSCMLEEKEAWMVSASGRKTMFSSENQFGIQLWRAAARDIVQLLFRERGSNDE